MEWKHVQERANTGARLDIHSASMTGFRTRIYQFGRWDDDFKPCIVLIDTSVCDDPIMYLTIVPPEIHVGPTVPIRARAI